MSTPRRARGGSHIRPDRPAPVYGAAVERDPVDIHIERITRAAEEIAATLERLQRTLDATRLTILDQGLVAPRAPRSPEVQREALARERG
jgi:hypothetical protein